MELLRQLQARGLEVILGEDDRIGIRPADKLSPELAEQIKAHKPQLIEALRKQRRADGYRGSKAYPPKPQHRCPACKERNWWLSRYGAWTCRICHPPQPGAEVEPEAYQSIAKGQKIDSRSPEKVSRWCTGYEPPRFVHIDVCAWHISEGDVNCANCQHLGRKEKELLMDSYLNKAIARLNAEGVVYYKPGDSQAKRNQIYGFEKRITEAFLACDIKAFVQAVDNWERCFDELRSG